jgi:hypothetical protein
MDIQKPKTTPPPTDIPFAKDTPVPITIKPEQSSPFPSQGGKIPTPSTIGIPLHVRAETIPPSLKPAALQQEPVLPPIIKESAPPIENMPIQTAKQFSLHVKAESASDAREFSPQKAIAIIIAFLFVVWLFWFLFIKTSPEGVENIVDSGLNMATSTLNINLGKKDDAPEISFYNGWVKIIGIQGVKEMYPEKEYITISVIQENASMIDVTNWYLINKKGVKAKLGTVSSLPLFGKVNPTSEFKINGGDILVVSTGRSPIGVSFRLNTCSSYLEQFQDFIPPIPEGCPQIKQTSDYRNLGIDCQRFMETIPVCQTNTGPFPSNVTATCKAYINAHKSHNGCVTDKMNEGRFYKKEWRVFLGAKTEIWDNKSDVISLYDEKDRLIHSIKY